MKILIACEFSGALRDELITRGHEAWSIDILPGEGHNVHRHEQADIMRVLDPMRGYTFRDGVTRWPNYWHMLIAFPPCTYLCSSGLHWNKRVAGRAEKTEQALELVRFLLNQPIDRIALENPPGCIGTRIHKATQYIHPHQFGHDASKTTGLWLKGLPPLQPTAHIAPRMVNGKPRWANQTDSGQNRLGPSPDRAQIRGTTYPGIAAAMAEQWTTGA